MTTPQETIREDYLDRFAEVVKGLGLSHNIANKLANFIHFEIMTAISTHEAKVREGLIEKLPKKLTMHFLGNFDTLERRAGYIDGFNNYRSQVLKVLGEKE